MSILYNLAEKNNVVLIALLERVPDHDDVEMGTKFSSRTRLPISFPWWGLSSW